METCPCGSGNNYEECCEIFHKGENPKTAKELMQARYCAFVKNQIQFIADTHIPGTTDFNIDEAREWATSSKWLGLEVLSTKAGLEDNETGMVEFKAIYQDSEEKNYIHHEISTFKKIENVWYYEDGQIVGTGPLRREGPKVGRNEPCPCGSGKKYKKCCGRAA